MNSIGDTLARILFVVGWLAMAAAFAGPLPTVPVVQREVDLTYTADGVIEAVRQSTVSAQIAGRITEIDFDVADVVKKGQVLLRIDDTEVSQAFIESRAVLAQAEAGYENAKANYERTKQLYERKFVSQAALDRAEAEYQSAKSQMEARKAGQSIAANTKSYATVIAPYSGVVLARHVELGEMAAPGKPLMTGFDPTDLRVVVNLPQDRVQQVRAIKLASVELPALGRRVKPTDVTVKPGADPRTHTTQTRLELPAGQTGAYPGMFARVYFVVGRAKKTLIPASAVLRRSELTAVYVVDDKGIARLRQIRIGEPVDDKEVEVLAGLSPGESVAIDPVKAGIVAGAQAAAK
jgi:membrane fusion protein, multidrug efflux system